MRRTITAFLLMGALATAAPPQKRKSARQTKAGSDNARVDVNYTARVNDPALREPVCPNTKGPGTLRAQILLARQHISPGEIDGACGSNLINAIKTFQAARQLPGTGTVDEATWAALNAGASAAPEGAAAQPATGAPATGTPDNPQNQAAASDQPAAPASATATGPDDVLTTYTLTEADVRGPYEPIPRDMQEQAKLSNLGYESLAEKLGEQFHSSPALIKRLNPGVAFTAGAQITVPNVAGNVPTGRAATVVVSESTKTLVAYDSAGKVLFAAPASMGSEHDPLPIGEWKINGVGRNPVFHYNPALFWDADPSHSKAKIAPGPNNPVGVVWIDLSKEHYGIHGTPNPTNVGKTQSHGCIRLTNWDVTALAGLVNPGVKVLMKE